MLSAFKFFGRRLLNLSRTGRTRTIRGIATAIKASPALAPVIVALLYYDYITPEEAELIAQHAEVELPADNSRDVRKLVTEIKKDTVQEDNKLLYMGGGAVAGALAYYMYKNNK